LIPRYSFDIPPWKPRHTRGFLSLSVHRRSSARFPVDAANRRQAAALVSRSMTRLPHGCVVARPRPVIGTRRVGARLSLLVRGQKKAPTGGALSSNQGETPLAVAVTTARGNSRCALSALPSITGHALIRFAAFLGPVVHEPTLHPITARVMADA
jgi:hypothetical protein